MSDLIGRQFKQYRIDAQIGEGGMGTVYRGWDVNLSRPVAIKVMHNQFARQEHFRERFMQEAKAPARLSHPSIVHIYDFDNTDGVLYLVMELVQGKTLSRYIVEARQSGRLIHLRETLGVLGQVADALDYAHRNGVVHRDIKPDNIMLRVLPEAEEGEVPLRAQVTDFGLAKLLEGGVETRTGSFMGTLQYMSPEQCLAQPIDGRSDIYSLGVVLYQLATGRLPLDIQSPTDAVLKHQQETPPTPRLVQPGVPPGVEAIILKAIAKKPDERYATASAMRNDLKRAAAALAAPDLERFSTPERMLSMVTRTKEGARLPEPPPQLRKATLPGDTRIDILAEGETMRSQVMRPGSIRVGRGEDNDLVLQDVRLSRHHARIDYDGQNFTVTDLNSTNGTFMNDIRLLAGVPEPWPPGALLYMGSHWLRCHVSRPSTQVEPVAAPSPGPAAPPPENRIIYVSLARRDFQTNSGSSLNIRLGLINQGNLVDHFQVVMLGLPPEWPAPEPVSVQLMPGERGEVELSVPPPPRRVTAGRHATQLRITGRTTMQGGVLEDISLNVAPFYAFQLRLQPQRQRSFGKARFNLELENQSNTAIQARLSASDPLGAGGYTFTPDLLQVPAFGRNLAQLDVQLVGKGLTSGISLAFTVSARVEAEELVVQQAQGEWQPVIPDLQLEVNPAEVSSPKQASFKLQLHNQSPEAFEVELEANDPQNALLLAIEPARLTLPGNGLASAQLNVQSRLAMLEEQEIAHRVVISARLSGQGMLLRQGVARWVQQPEKKVIVPDLRLQVVPPEISGQQWAAFSVQLTNLVEMALEVELTAKDLQNALALSLEPARLSLPALGSGSAVLHVEPRQPLLEAKEVRHLVQIEARLAGQPAVLKQGEARWVQQGQPEKKAATPNLQLEVVPPEITGQKWAAFSVQLHNLVDAAYEVELSASDAQNALALTLEPARLALPAAGSVSAVLHVEPRLALLEQKEVTHRLTIYARLPGQLTVLKQASARWIQQPVPEAGARPAGAAAARPTAQAAPQPPPVVEKPPTPTPTPTPAAAQPAAGRAAAAAPAAAAWSAFSNSEWAADLPLPEPLVKKSGGGGCATAWAWVMLLGGLLVTAAGGLILYNYVVYSEYMGETAGWIAMLIIWAIGTWISFKAFNGVRRSKG